MICELRAIEAEAQQLLNPIMDNNRPVGLYLKMLDQKIDLLARYLVTQSKGDDLLHKETVSLSEGGITFYSHQNYDLGDYLHLTLILFPGFSSLSTIAEVKSVQDLEQKPAHYRIGAEFNVLLEADRKQLARHIRRKQSLLLRERTFKPRSSTQD
jgi:hypothetical protein